MLLYLKNIIEVHGLPQYEVARMLGISEARLSRVLAGRLAFTDAERERIIENFTEMGISFERSRLFEATRRGVRVLPGAVSLAPTIHC